MSHKVERVITAADRGYATEIDFKVGERVLFHCFDKSTIEVMVTEVDGDLVYGVSDKGTNHWANKKDVKKLK